MDEDYIDANYEKISFTSSTKISNLGHNVGNASKNDFSGSKFSGR